MNSIQKGLPQLMKCYLKRQTYVVKLIVLLLCSSLSLGGVLTEDKALRIAKEKLQEEFGDKVKLNRVSVYISKPIEFVSIEKTSLRAREGSPRGSLHIYLKTKKGLRRVSVSLDLLWRCRVFVALEDIPVGERLYPWQVTLEERFLRRCPKQSIQDPQELINYVAMRKIPKGEVLRKSKLKREHLVKRGDEITLIFRKGALEINFVGTALENGYYGEVIRVRSANTGKVLRGKVVSENALILK